MTVSRTHGLACLLVVVLPLCAVAQEAPPRPSTESLIEQLGASSFSEREAAEAELRSRGATARAALERAVTSSDPETRWRASRLLDDLRAAAGEQKEPAATAKPEKPARGQDWRQLESELRGMLEPGERPAESSRSQREEEWERQRTPRRPPVALPPSGEVPPEAWRDLFDELEQEGRAWERRGRSLGREGADLGTRMGDWGRRLGERGSRERAGREDPWSIPGEPDAMDELAQLLLGSMDEMMGQLEQELGLESLFENSPGSIEPRDSRRLRVLRPRLEASPRIQGEREPREDWGLEPPQLPLQQDVPERQEARGRGIRLGFRAEPASELVKAQLGLPGGLAITQVTRGGVADRAGLQVHDILISVEETHVLAGRDLQRALAGHKRGDSCEVRIVRAGQEQRLQMTLE